MNNAQKELLLWKAHFFHQNSGKQKWNFLQKSDNTFEMKYFCNYGNAAFQKSFFFFWIYVVRKITPCSQHPVVNKYSQRNETRSQVTIIRRISIAFPESTSFFPIAFYTMIRFSWMFLVSVIASDRLHAGMKFL